MDDKERELLDNASLPKWPQMIVRGFKLTTEQASEIIRRTDTFFSSGYGGNDRIWVEAVKIAVKMPILDYGMSAEEWGEIMPKLEEWQRRWEILSTDYVHNTWISSSYIFGPYGWCHPDGTIGYGDNVGKWPSAEDIYDDWVKLAEAFPFVTAHVLLMDREHSEDDAKPVIGFRINDGRVSVHSPDEPGWFEGMDSVEEERGMDAIKEATMKIATGDLSRENGISMEMIESWSSQVFGE